MSPPRAGSLLAALGQLAAPGQRGGAPVVSASVRGSLERIGERGLRFALLWSFPLALLVMAAWPWHPAYSYGWDFRALYVAGADYLHLHSPYVRPSLANLTGQQNFVYPMPMAALFAPLSLLPYAVAAALFIAASAALLGLALWILGIRDWRCYAAAYLSLPVQLGLKLGTISPLLAFLLAVLWRYRNRTAVVAPALALAVVSKLFLWPVALWFLFTRRVRGFVAAAVLSAVVVLAASAPVGLDSLLRYPSLVHALSAFEAPQSFSTYALLYGLGLSGTAALVGAALGGIALLALAYRWAGADEARAFRATILASLILSPIVWSHYLVVLLVALALWRPRFSPLWFALAWLTYDGYVLSHVFFVAATAAVLALMVVQAGVVDLDAVRSLRTLKRRLRLRDTEAMVAIWLPYLVVSGGVFSAVLVASLRPSPGTSSASGTAIVRLASSRTVCWQIWTSGVPTTASVSLVSTATGRVVAARRLGRGPRDETCAPIRPVDGRALRRSAQSPSASFALRVVAADGRPLLSGQLLQRVDAGSQGRALALRAQR